MTIPRHLCGAIKPTLLQQHFGSPMTSRTLGSSSENHLWCSPHDIWLAKHQTWLAVLFVDGWDFTLNIRLHTLFHQTWIMEVWWHSATQWCCRYFLTRATMIYDLQLKSFERLLLDIPLPKALEVNQTWLLDDDWNFSSSGFVICSFADLYHQTLWWKSWMSVGGSGFLTTGMFDFDSHW